MFHYYAPGPKCPQMGCMREGCQWQMLYECMWIKISLWRKMGFQISLRGNRGDQLMLSHPNCTCVLNYPPAQRKLALNPDQNKHFFNAFTQVASSFMCAQAQGRVRQRAGLNISLQLGTVGSKVNSDFLFTLKDLRPLWFPVVSWCVCFGFWVCLYRAPDRVSRVSWENKKSTISNCQPILSGTLCKPLLLRMSVPRPSKRHLLWKDGDSRDFILYLKPFRDCLTFQVHFLDIRLIFIFYFSLFTSYSH